MTYAVNLNDGRVVAFNEEVAKQTAYAQVPEDIAHAIAEGSLDWRKVAELVHKKRNNDPSFSWEAFDTLRDHQNIRKAKYDPVEPEKAAEPVPDAVQQVSVTMDEVTGGRVRKATDNVSSGDAIAHSEAPKARATAQKVML